MIAKNKPNILEQRLAQQEAAKREREKELERAFEDSDEHPESFGDVSVGDVDNSASQDSNLRSAINESGNIPVKDEKNHSA